MKIYTDNLHPLGTSSISKWFHLSCYIVARLQVSENQLKVIKLKGEFTVWYNLEVQAWLDPQVLTRQHQDVVLFYL